MTKDELERHVLESDLPEGYEFHVNESRAHYRSDRGTAWPACINYCLMVVIDRSPDKDEFVVHENSKSLDVLKQAFDEWLAKLPDGRLIENPDFVACDL